jgi:hypothetical protein
MTDVRREKIQVSLLDVGMFVCELDRPWLSTPFMLEGLLIEDDEQITKIASLCEFVYVDRTVSVGRHFTAAPKEQVAMKRDGTVNRVAIDANTGKRINNAINKSTKLGTPNVKFSFLKKYTREIKLLDLVKQTPPSLTPHLKYSRLMTVKFLRPAMIKVLITQH